MTCELAPAAAFFDIVGAENDEPGRIENMVAKNAASMSCHFEDPKIFVRNLAGCQDVIEIDEVSLEVIRPIDSRLAGIVA
ncbi:MAG: hypothetical protein ACR2RA_19865 [Geminicoccaceae bacterium]